MKLYPIIIGGVIAVVLISAILIPITNDSPSKGGWVYDDYQKCPADTVVSGAFETVLFDGETYIHAKDVGKGVINGKTYSVSKADLSVFLLWGQSNSMYLNADPEQVNAEFEPLESTRAYFYGISNDSDYRPIISWKSGTTAVYPENGQFLSMTSPDGKFLIGNIEAPFAAIYAENPEGFRPYIINAGVGGMSLQSFLPGTIYNTNIHNIWTSALSKIDTSKFNVRPTAWIMSQGEANAGTPPAKYLEYFSEVYADIVDYCGIEDGIIIQTRYANSSNANKAQNMIVSEYPQIIMGSTASSDFTISNGLLATDDIHYTQLGDNIVGAEAAQAWLDHTEPSKNKLLSMVPILAIAAVIASIAIEIFRKTR